MSSSRLIDVAVREFAQRGLEGASTRGIAAAAGTAMSAITYHYGGKEGLYAAVAGHIDARMADQMGSVLPDRPLPAGVDEARAEARRLLDRLVVKFVGDADIDWSLFIMREHMHPTDAFDRFYHGTIGRLAHRLVALVRTATGASERDARIAALTLFGQVVVWRSSRALVDRLLTRPLDAESEAAIRRQIASNTDGVLDRLIAEQHGRARQQEPQ